MAIVFDWQEESIQKLIDNCPSEPVTPYLFKYLRKDMRILEAGCGSGRFVYFLDKFGYKIEGIEINKRTVDIINEKFPHLNIKYGDVTKLEYENESLDAIISLGVIEHVVEGIDGPIKEMFRVLKPGGLAVVIVPSFNKLRQIKYYLGLLHLSAFLKILKDNNIIRKLFNKTPLYNTVKVPRSSKYKTEPILGNFYEYRFRKHEFENELKKGGFEIIESVPVSLVDGIYQELGKLFAKLNNHTFTLTKLGMWTNNFLSKFPFFHNHMHLCIVKKRNHYNDRKN
ncbi:MAG: class I SAM-dependent methyltransferase [Candidatus Nanoarchaeia archaeon]